MKVKELIQVLQRYDPESKVAYEYDGFYLSPNRFRECVLQYDEERRDFFIEEWYEDYKKMLRDWLDFAAKDKEIMNPGDKIVLMDMHYDGNELHIGKARPRKMTEADVQKLRDGAAKVKGLPLHVALKGGPANEQ